MSGSEVSEEVVTVCPWEKKNDDVMLQWEKHCTIQEEELHTVIGQCDQRKRETECRKEELETRLDAGVVSHEEIIKETASKHTTHEEHVPQSEEESHDLLKNTKLKQSLEEEITVLQSQLHLEDLSQNSMSMSSLLKFSHVKTENKSSQFIFTHIDEASPNKEFTLELCIVNNKLQVSHTVPQLQDVGHLEEKLNEGHDIMKFLVGIRCCFKNQFLNPMVTTEN